MINLTEKNGLFYIDSVVQKTLPVLSKKYQTAAPFSHIVIDDFLTPSYLEKIIANFPKKEDASVIRKSTTQYLKNGYRPQELGSNPCSNYLSLLNTMPILDFLEKLTGINGLIPDPYFLGGGLHETEKNGFLDIHLDFSLHKKLHLARRLNMIIFLNKNWQPEYQGNLELWDSDMKQKEVSIEPVFNRCVVFNTTHNSYHGQPTPVNCPSNMTRKSIALYYYSTIDKQTKQLTPVTKWHSKEINSKFSLKKIFRK